MSLRTFAPTSRISTSRKTHLKPRTGVSTESEISTPTLYLSKSMEKTFLRMKSRPSARHAYVEAELTTGLAHQIRAVRLQRNWTQGELAKRLGTTQANVSRLEDPSYGRYTLTTLIDLAKVFDTGMQVKFVSFVTMLANTFHPTAKGREVASFEEEAQWVEFFRPSSVLSVQPSTFDIFSGSAIQTHYVSVPIESSKYSTTQLVEIFQ